MKRAVWGVGLAVMLGMAPSVQAQQGIVLREVLGNWRGDDTIQFVELLMIEDFQIALSGRAALVFEDATGTTQQTFLFTKNVAGGIAGLTVLVATARLGELVNVIPDLVLPDGLLAPASGRVCYRAADALGEFSTIDCLAYGEFSGGTGTYGPPVRAMPTNRSLDRVDDTGFNRTDWQGLLEPTPQTNAGLRRVMITQCGNGEIDLGEECDGDELDGATCASLGFVRGKLRCNQCHFNTAKCTFCGNGELNDGEQCDGADLDGAVCQDLGFTGGTLACGDKCDFDTTECSSTFYVPGNGPKKKDCLTEWLVENPAGKPGANGKAKTTQKCDQGDSGCDFDADPTTCTFRLQVCFRLADARLPDCTAGAIDSWELRRAALDDGSAAGVLLDAVTTLGGTQVDDTVTFTPPLDDGSPCTDTVRLAVPVKSTLKLKARAIGGDVTDADVLKLDCRP